MYVCVWGVGGGGGGGGGGGEGKCMNFKREVEDEIKFPLSFSISS